MKYTSLRLQTYIKNNANKTKSEVIKLFQEGRILVNGKIVPLPTFIKEDDVVTIDDCVIENLEFVYYLYNKPVGIVCTNDISKENNIKHHLAITKGIKERIYTVGRLDKDSRGLIILTNDNMFCDSIINNDNHIEKEYYVTLENEIDDEFIINMSKGVELNNKYVRGCKTKECVVSKIDNYTFSIILNEGKYRQIRRMVAMNNNKVVDLFRIRIGNITIFDYKLDNDDIVKINNIMKII